MTVVVRESLGHEGYEPGSNGIQTMSAPSMYFLAPVTSGSSLSSNNSSFNNERAEQSFRQILFQLIPDLCEFGQIRMEWHALNFCCLDTLGYMAAMRNNGLPQLTLRERFWAKLTHFRILL